VIYEKRRAEVKGEYVWRYADRWINFPRSVQPPVLKRVGQVLNA
jgi:hypothetical protein